jgi:hypothetical protein
MRNRLLTVCAGFLLLLYDPTSNEKTRKKGEGKVRKRNVKSCKCDVTADGLVWRGNKGAK